MRKLKRMLITSLIGFSVLGGITTPVIDFPIQAEAATNVFTTKNGVLYKNGNVFTGTKEGLLYHNGIALTGIKYENGEYSFYYGGKKNGGKTKDTTFTFRYGVANFTGSSKKETTNKEYYQQVKIIDKNGVVKIVSAIIDGGLCSSANGNKLYFIEVKEKSGKKTTYYTAYCDGGKYSYINIANYWLKTTKGNWFFLKNGRITTGWKKLAAADGEKTVHWSYFGAEGRLRVGWQSMGKGTGNSYAENTVKHMSYFGSNGWLRTGMQDMGKDTKEPDGGKAKHKSYFGDNGWLVVNKEFKLNGKTYIANNSGWLSEKFSNLSYSFYRGVLYQSTGYSINPIYGWAKKTSTSSIGPYTGWYKGVYYQSGYKK